MGGRLTKRNETKGQADEAFQTKKEKKKKSGRKKTPIRSGKKKGLV